MGYNQNAPAEPSKNLAPDILKDGIIIAIIDGKIGEFPHTETWKNKGEAGIEVTISAKHENQDHIVRQVFSYNPGEVLKYAPNSNIGKYIKKYGHQPKIGDVVKLITNSEGWFRLIIE